MARLREAVEDFLARKRIAVVGVSRGDGAANTVYRKLRGAGYQVFAVNPKADELEGDRCYRELRAIPGGVDGVVIVTHSAVTDQIVRECVEVGVSRIWMHRSFGAGSVSETAVTLCRQKGIAVIPGGCPMMYCEPVDVGHRCMRWILNLTGGLPRYV